MIDKRKEKQQELIDCIIQNKYSGIFVASPRFGKTYCLLKALEPIQHLKILIIVPFDTIKKSWEFEINKWGYTGELDIILKTSVKKVDLTSYDLIVKDECHSLSESEILCFKQAKKPICAITGTLGKKVKDKWLYQLGVKEKFRYDVIDAVEDSIVSDYKVTVHYCQLDNKELDVEFKGKLYTEKQAYELFTRNMDYFKRINNPKIKLYYAGLRARLIYSSKNKITLAKSLIKTKRRVLVFTALTKVANKLCRSVYHSQAKNDNLNRFENGKINKLATISMVDMGVTLSNLKHCIVHQLNSVEERAIQRVLRVMNIDGNRIADIDILCVKDTVDEDWCKSSLSFVPETKINYIQNG
jgi:superfamily II DNA or RNA helicase